MLKINNALIMNVSSMLKLFGKHMLANFYTYVAPSDNVKFYEVCLEK